MTDPGGANNSINDTTVHGTAFQARDVDQVVINHYATPAPNSTDGTTDTPLSGWAREVADSPLWQRLPPTRDPAPLRTAARDIAAALAALHDETEWEATGDPWWDRSFPTRFHGQLSQLLCAEDAPEADFHPAEILLLTLAPYLSQTLWARTAADRVGVDPTDLRLTGAGGDRGDFERFFDRGHERLVRRARLTLPERPGAEADIGWWLFHQWIDNGLRGTEDHWAAYADLRERLPRAGGSLSALFHQRRMGQLLYGLRLPLGETARPERVERFEAVTSLRCGTGMPQKVRTGRLSLLLAIARARALDIPALPDDLVENLGVPHRVDLSEVHATVGEATWHHDNGPMVLQAADCHHEAVVEALRRHVTEVDDLLYDIHRAARNDELLEPLRALPQRASAEGVEAALGDDGRPKFESYGKFQVDTRRVQELLMGDQLYRSPGLAIRELYQNALDACRYRRARTEYLSIGQIASRDDWTGRIRFEQGIGEDGRPYLVCEDNGIGMSESELGRVFARAGTRFTDLTEVRNERSTWETAGIRLHPVSRFGIGVLSYFMIADEIEVVTRKVGKDGATSEPCFKVAIYGPNHVFRIERSTERRAPGTTVRLYLRDGAPSCATELERLLGVAEFETTAQHGGRSVRWEAGVYRLRPSGSWPEPDAFYAQGPEMPGPPAVGGGAPHVVWCRTGGGVLVDGIFTRLNQRNGVLEPVQDGGEALSGAVVNLTGDRVPKLSVDRLQILSDASADVEELLQEAVGVLAEPPVGLLTFDWISNLADNNYRVADIVTRAATEGDWALTLWDGRSLRLGGVGFMPRDRLIVGSDRGGINPLRRREVPDSILLWRLLALAGGEPFAELVPELRDVGPTRPALPSDEVLLNMTPDTAPKSAEIARAAQVMGMTPRQIAVRLTELRLVELDPAAFPDDHPDEYDHALLHDGLLRTPYRTQLERGPVPLGHFIEANVGLGLSPRDSAARMARYGFDVSAADMLPERLHQDDLRLLSANGDGTGGWLQAGDVPPGHVLWMAHLTGQSPVEVCRRLRSYGLRADAPPPRQGPHDLRLLSLSLDCRPGWLPRGQTVLHVRIAWAAGHCGLSVQEVRDILTAYGLRPEEEQPKMNSGTSARQGFDWAGRPSAGFTSSRSPNEPMEKLLREARAHGLSPAAMVRKIREDGFDLPLEFPDPLTELDEALLDPDVDLWRERRGADVHVSFLQVMLTADRLMRPPKTVAVRLASYGLTVGVPDCDTLPGLSEVNAYLRPLSRDFDGGFPWIAANSRLSLQRLLVASRGLHMAVAEVADRYRGFGYDVPDVSDTVRAAMAKLPRLPRELDPGLSTGTESHLKEP
ncbi:hypothetical protein ACFZCL_17800 [Streptomyces sp. NPDC008159]|uniref:wHTH domain-containing protein n=1 Tax=Streptomyces sp. NPDC008159 TaxID=3364817 RepID=UPI0036EFCDB5